MLSAWRVVVTGRPWAAAVNTTHLYSTIPIVFQWVNKPAVCCVDFKVALSRKEITQEQVKIIISLLKLARNQPIKMGFQSRGKGWLGKDFLLVLYYCRQNKITSSLSSNNIESLLSFRWTAQNWPASYTKLDWISSEWQINCLLSGRKSLLGSRHWWHQKLERWTDTEALNAFLHWQGYFAVILWSRHFEVNPLKAWWPHPQLRWLRPKKSTSRLSIGSRA